MGVTRVCLWYVAETCKTALLSVHTSLGDNLQSIQNPIRFILKPRRQSTKNMDS